MNTRGPGRPTKNEGKSLDARIEFRATDDELARFRTAAALAGVGLSDWLRSTLNAAANQQNSEHGDTLKLQNKKEGGNMQRGS